VNCLAGQEEHRFKKAGLAHSGKGYRDMELGEMRKSEWIWLPKDSFSSLARAALVEWRGHKPGCKGLRME